jgi:DNA-binding MarR family transcriptional regulator
MNSAPVEKELMRVAAQEKHTRREGIAEDKSDATVELILEVAQFFFRIRALGQKSGLITDWGGGAFGFMRSLAVLGPLTVPQIAKTRPTSRQRMQRLADELAAAGLVTFAENPQHRRSRLVQLTRDGEARYAELDEQLRRIAADISGRLDEAEIRLSARTVSQLSAEVAARI